MCIYMAQPWEGPWPLLAPLGSAPAHMVIIQLNLHTRVFLQDQLLLATTVGCGKLGPHQSADFSFGSQLTRGVGLDCCETC
jgi:hypothetical protein